MEPFIHLREYSLVVCRQCRFACVASEVSTHLKKKHTEIAAEERERIAQAVDAVPGLVRDQAGLEDFRLPPRTTEPIPYLAWPKSDGLGCKTCGYVTRTTQWIQQHCRKEHGWANDWVRGGNVKRRSRRARELPWTTGVRCQRFFPSRAASSWFEVGGSSHAETDTVARENPLTRFERTHQEARIRLSQADAELVQVADEKKEPNAWLERAGWAGHLQGLASDKLRGLLSLGMKPDDPDEARLQRMLDILDRVLDQGRATAMVSKIGLAAAFEVERRELGVKARKPFDHRLEEDTWARYKEVWQKLLCYWFRVQGLDDEEQPPYSFTERQEQLWDEFEEAVEPGSGVGSDRRDRMCLDMLVGILDHQLGDSDYDSILLSGLAVMGIREDGGWVDAEDYTGVYSAVIKVARMLVATQAYLERREHIAQLRAADTNDDELRSVRARNKGPSMFKLVRQKVRRFMTRVSDRKDAEPTPMDWILDTRSYGLRIRFTTVATGSIDWRGDRVVYKRLQFGMGALSDMLHTLVEESRAILTELAMGEADDVDALPAIDWAAEAAVWAEETQVWAEDVSGVSVDPDA